MSKFAEPMARLIDELKKLPGVGGKSAQRLAFHILRSSSEDADGLAAASAILKKSFIFVLYVAISLMLIPAAIAPAPPKPATGLCGGRAHEYCVH